MLFRSGVAATLFFALFVPGSQVPLIGASGAISGILGFYFVWFPRNQVKVFVFLFPLLMTHVLIPAAMPITTSAARTPRLPTGLRVSAGCSASLISSSSASASPMSRSLREGAFSRQRSITVRAQANNVFNNVQWGSIDAVVNSPTFGQVTSVRSMRSVTFSIRAGF